MIGQRQCDYKVLRVWTWPHGYRCVLVVTQSMLELQIVREFAVLSRARYTDLDQAVEAAQRWRLDFEIGCTTADVIEDLCAVCGDAPVVERDPDSGIEWQRCASCGDVWMATRE
jgi:hypothetical protein